MVRISVALDEQSWRELRDIAEIERIGHRASVSGIILRAVRELLSQRRMAV
jgi:Arc/MetJ-type ribon-helix-helix transcriptional regulator